MICTGTYQIVCRTTGKKYIGSTSDKRGFSYRWNCHLQMLRSGNHSSPRLQAAWNKYGEDDFLFLVLDRVEGRKECLAWEQMYFDTVPSDTLLNCKLLAAGGGMIGKKHSAETKQKMSDAKKGRYVSEETCRRISEGKKGQGLGEKHPERGAAISAAKTGKKRSTPPWNKGLKLKENR